MIVSGDEAAVDAARPLFAHIGANLYYVGGQEQARVIKLAVNSLLAATAEMLAEVITVCEASGIDRSILLDVVSGFCHWFAVRQVQDAGVSRTAV